MSRTTENVSGYPIWEPKAYVDCIELANSIDGDADTLAAIDDPRHTPITRRCQMLL